MSQGVGERMLKSDGEEGHNNFLLLRGSSLIENLQYFSYLQCYTHQAVMVFLRKSSTPDAVSLFWGSSINNRPINDLVLSETRPSLKHKFENTMSVKNPHCTMLQPIHLISRIKLLSLERISSVG